MTKKKSMRRVDGPGLELKQLRVQKGWTLADLSKRTGMPVSSLSKMENDRIALTYDKLVHIVSGLGADISQIFPSEGAKAQRVGGRRSINRAGQEKLVDTGSYLYRYLSTDLLAKDFVPIIGEVRARSLEEFGELIRHEGEEFVFVLDGAIEVHTDTYAPVRLEKGDSMYFDSRMGHAYIAGAPGLCRMLSISSGPVPPELHRP